MINKILPALLLFMVSCSSPNPPVNTTKPKTHSKNKSVSPKPPPGSWNISTYSGAQGDQQDSLTRSTRFN